VPKYFVRFTEGVEVEADSEEEAIAVAAESRDLIPISEDVEVERV